MTRSDRLYVVIEYFNAGAAPDIHRRARDQERQLPPGLEYVDSWADLTSRASSDA